jgi:CRISPR-associated protein Csb2
MLTIAWQYLTGLSYSSVFNNREEPEWPVHPDRVYQALVATWAERGKNEEEEAALNWLEQQGPPDLCMPPENHLTKIPKTYVPVNDISASATQRNKAEYGDNLTGLLPTHRPRKDRLFPFVHIGDGICAMMWKNADPELYVTALRNLCCNVNRIGHSSSLVRCWVSNNPYPVNYLSVATGSFRDIMLRVPERGRINSLCNAFNLSVDTGIIRYAPIARQFGYVRVSNDMPVPHGHFSSRLLVFTQVDGQQFDLRQSLDLARAFRGLLLTGAEELGEYGVLPKALISGHEADGQPMQRPHLAFLPLGYVGSEYADGHILGMAIAIPCETTAEEEQGLYAALARKMADDGTFQLRLGKKGFGIFSYVDTPHQYTLKERTWNRHCCKWASVTPIVMNQAAKKNDYTDLEAWASQQISLSCEHQGLPRPTSIAISPISFLKGSFPCYARGSQLTGFFPRYETKQGMKPYLFHAKLTFPVEISGPLLLGSGRYRGYGLCKPMEAI